METIVLVLVVIYLTVATWVSGCTYEMSFDIDHKSGPAMRLFVSSVIGLFWLPLALFGEKEDGP
jgi:hypothetical protein